MRIYGKKSDIEETSQSEADPLLDGKWHSERLEDSHDRYCVTRRRFAVALSVILINLATNSMWVSFAPITSDVAFYYGKQPAEVNMLAALGLVIGLPITLIATLIVERFGMRTVVTASAVLTFIGATIRFLTTLLDISLDVKFSMLILSQIFVGLAHPFGFCIPTKIALDWFPVHESEIAGGLMTMSTIFGMALGYGVVPFIVRSPEQVPLINQIWYGLAVAASLVTISSFTSDCPRVPPCTGAQDVREPMSYLKSFGFFSLGIFPLMYHLATLLCQPVNPAIGLACINFASLFFFAIFQLLGAVTSLPLLEKFEDIETCSRGDSVKAEEHSTFLYMMCGILTANLLIFVVLLRSKKTPRT